MIEGAPEGAIDLETSSFADDDVIVLYEEDANGNFVIEDGRRVEPPPAPEPRMHPRDAMWALHDIAAWHSDPR